MTRRYTIGGAAFVVDEGLPDLVEGDFADAELAVTFCGERNYRALVGAGLRRVDGPADNSGAIDLDTMRCWVLASSADPSDRAWRLRQMAPIFAAVVGRVSLHAGAVQIGDSVAAFVGASEVGKSTLVASFAQQGYRSVADDLLPVRFAPGPSAPVEGRLVELGMICFLQRTSGCTAEVRRLGAADALEGLIRNGFGEHGDRPTWAFQFDAYHQIVESVPAFDLAMPDDLPGLPRVVETVAALAHDVTTEEATGGSS